MAEYGDILDHSEIDVSSLSSSDAVADEPRAVIDAMRDAQDRIASYIGQPVMIHSHTQGIRRWEWSPDDVQDNHKVYAWADHRPLVEIDSGDPTIRFDSGRLLNDHKDDLKVTYFAGWIRSGQSLSDLPTATNDPLDGLTTEPPTLPGDIRRAAIKLTLFYLNEAEHRQGMGTTTAAIGGGDTITVEGPDPNFISRTLNSLSTYRRPTF